MLFTKEITSITFEDVVSFCKEQNPESINLDYKKDFPSHLEKIISAFANTMGGLIIIGVEDEDSKPKLPVTGLPYKEGYRERVNSIILSNIYPPIFPEIQVCPPVNNKTFVVVRVPQSNTTPHYIRNKTNVFVRTDDINHPEALATADRIEWLRDRRKKSEELKELLYSSPLERYRNNLKLRKLNEIEFCEATLSIVPLYPTEPYKTPQEINQICKDIVARGYGRNQFPDFLHRRPIRGGISSFFSHTKVYHYTEISQFGLIFHKEDLGVEEKTGVTGNEENTRIYIVCIMRLIDLFLEASAKFYVKIGYWGLVEFKFSLEKMLGVNIFWDDTPLRNGPRSVDEKLNWRKVYYIHEIRDKRLKIVIDLLKDIVWSLGWEYITEKNIKDLLTKYNRLPKN